MNNPDAITVYFDGLCPVCRREVSLYRRLDRPRRIRWRDLAGPDDVLARESFAMAAALERLHVRDADGRLHEGFDAHLLMWQCLPGFRRLSSVLHRWPSVRRVGERIYRVFTRHRPGRLLRQRTGHVTEARHEG